MTIMASKISLDMRYHNTNITNTILILIFYNNALFYLPSRLKFNHKKKSIDRFTAMALIRRHSVASLPLDALLNPYSFTVQLLI